MLMFGVVLLEKARCGVSSRAAERAARRWAAPPYPRWTAIIAQLYGGLGKHAFPRLDLVRRTGIVDAGCHN